MVCKEVIDNTNKIILVRFFGEIKKEEIVPKAKLTRLMALVLDYSIIFDFSKSQIHFSVSDAFYMVPRYYDTVDLRLKLVPVAHIPNKMDKSFFEFMETTFLNKGARLRLCKDEQDARAWLSRRHEELPEPSFLTN